MSKSSVSDKGKKLREGGRKEGRKEGMRGKEEVREGGREE